MTTQTVDLRPDLNRSLVESARLEKKTVGDLINDAVEYFLEWRWREALDRELSAYAAIHGELWRTQRGQWVAVYEGRLVDQDTDEATLVGRVRAQIGEVPVLICQVGPSPVEESWLRTPSTGRRTP